MKNCLLITFLLLSSCLSGQSDDVKIYNDLSYVSEENVANDSLQRLNLAIPTSTKKPPLLIWIGGGAWSYVNKDQEMDLAKQFASKAVAVASVGHRLSPATWRDPALNTGIQHPKHIEDVAAAVKWLYTHGEEYGFDKNRLFIGGYSSGAHLAALICLDPSYLESVELSPSIFSGVLPISGTYDIIDYHKVLSSNGRPELAELHVEAVFGSSKDQMINASPVTYLNNLSLAVLLISDNNMYNYSRLFEEKIRETEFRNMQVVYAYNLSHAELWRNLSFNESSLYRDVMLTFINTTKAD